MPQTNEEACSVEEVVSEILAALGYESAQEMEVGSHETVEAGGFEDLTIELVADGRLSVAHYYKQRGDLMRDPEVVFDVSGDDWTPVEFRQDPYIREYDPEGIDISEFAAQWGRNLKNQGFLEAARAD